MFFDRMAIGWEYEPEAFPLPSGNYLPDFRLANGTFIEVRGTSERVDLSVLRQQAIELYQPRTFIDPVMLLLGPIPFGQWSGDFAWWSPYTPLGLGGNMEDCEATEYYNFGDWFRKGNNRPWYEDELRGRPVSKENALRPLLVMNGSIAVMQAYRAARIHRFW